MPVGPWTGTDGNGDASVTVYCGHTPGTYTITAKWAKGTRAVFTLTDA
jgi:uncharacterized repeat protein (TIGR02543 family)